MKKNKIKASKKISPKKIAAPKQDRSSAKQIQHYNAILIEDLQSQFKFVVEKVMDSEERLMKKMDQKFEEVDTKFADINLALHYHSTMLKQADERLESHSRMHQQTNEILEQHSKMHQQTNEKLELHSKMHQQTNERLDRIELKLDKVAEKVERHDHDIEQLKLASSVL